MCVVYCTGDLLERMYPEEDPDQNMKRRDHLLDLYLNMPDKVKLQTTVSTLTVTQCCGSGSVFRRFMDPNPCLDPHK